jgi:hypothetical protein
MTTLMLDDEFVSLWHHPEQNVVHHKIKAFLLPGRFEKLLSAGAELMEKHGAVKWLSDDRDNVVVSPEDIKWADDVWFPRVKAAGFRYWAVVVPSLTVGAVQLKGLQTRRREQGVTVELFETVEAAMAWLARVGTEQGASGVRP